MASRNAFVWVAAVVGIAMGVGIGFLAFAKDAEKRGEGSGAEAAPRAASIATDSERAGVATAAPREAAKAGAPAAAASEADRKAAVEVASKVPVPAAKPGEGVITGEVKDPSGKPVAGVTLRAEPNYTQWQEQGRGRGQGPPAIESLESAVHKVADQFQRRASTRREARTDAEGKFSITGLTDTNYNVQGWLEGYDVKTRGGGWKARAGSFLTFTATPCCRIDLRVLLPNGDAASVAAVECRKGSARGADTSHEIWSPDRSAIYLMAGHWELRAIANETGDRDQDRQDLASESKSIDLAAGAAPQSLELQLKPRLGIRGRLKAAPEEADSDFNVGCLEVPPGREPDLKALASAQRTSWSRGGNDFTFLDLTAGTYVVGVTRGWNQALAGHTLVSVVDKIAEVELEVLPPDPGDAWIVRVLGRNGQPVADVDFRLEIQTGGNRRGTGTQGVRRPGGDYWVTPDPDTLELLRKKSDPNTKIRLTARSNEYGEQDAELTLAERNVTIQFAEVATLSVTIVGYKGSGSEVSYSVSARRASADGERRGMNMRQPDETGKVTLTPLTPGDYDVGLHIRTRSDGGGSYPIGALRVPVRSGENAVSIAIPPLYPLAVRIPEGGSGSRVSISRVESADGLSLNSSKETDENGVARFDLLPAGDYDVQYFGGSGPGTMRVRVPTQSEVAFKAEPINCVAVTITDPQGALAKAGLQNGDRIVAIDGRELTNAQEVMMSMGFASSKKDVAIKVERGGKILELTVPGSVLQSRGGNLGGRLRPASK